MDVRVEIQFKKGGEKELAAMKSLANDLTNRREGVRVFPDPANPDMLVAEFTMVSEAQYKAVDRIFAAIRFWAENRLDSAIQFPRSEAQILRDRRKAEKRKARRRSK